MMKTNHELMSFFFSNHKENMISCRLHTEKTHTAAHIYNYVPIFAFTYYKRPHYLPLEVLSFPDLEEYETLLYLELEDYPWRHQTARDKGHETTY